MRDFILNPERYEIDVPRHAGLSVLGAIETISEHIFNMRWVVGESKEQHLVLSDNPVTRISDPATHSPFRSDGGFRNPTVRVQMPLTPRYMLEMGWADVEDTRIINIPRKLAREMNRLRTLSAQRYVFASKCDDGILKLCNKWLTLGKESMIVANHPTAKINVKR